MGQFSAVQVNEGKKDKVTPTRPTYLWAELWLANPNWVLIWQSANIYMSYRYIAGSGPRLDVRQDMVECIVDI